MYNGTSIKLQKISSLQSYKVNNKNGTKNTIKKKLDFCYSKFMNNLNEIEIVSQRRRCMRTKIVLLSFPYLIRQSSTQHHEQRTVSAVHDSQQHNNKTVMRRFSHFSWINQIETRTNQHLSHSFVMRKTNAYLFAQAIISIVIHLDSCIEWLLIDKSKRSARMWQAYNLLDL